MYTELIERYREYMKVRSYADRTIEAYIDRIKGFTEYLTSVKCLKRIQDITRKEIRDWQSQVHCKRRIDGSTSLSISSKSSMIRGVKSFFLFLIKTNEIVYNPAIDLEYPKEGERIITGVLKKNEVNKLINAAKGATVVEVRDRAILELMYTCGIRNTEMRDLQLEDICLDQEEVIVRRGKGGKGRVLPLGRLASGWIETYIEEARPGLVKEHSGSVLFLTTRGEKLSRSNPAMIVQKYAKKAGIKKRVYAHLLRHTCATHLLKGGADIRYVQELLGHVSLDTTKIYTKLEITDLKKMHRRTHPREKI